MGFAPQISGFCGSYTSSNIFFGRQISNNVYQINTRGLTYGVGSTFKDNYLNNTLIDIKVWKNITTTSTTTTTTTAVLTTTTTTTTTSTTTTTTTPIPTYNVSLYWRIASNNFAAGKLAYSTNGGSSWTVSTNVNIGENGSYNSPNPSVITGLYSGSSLWIGILDTSSSNVKFGIGLGGPYTGYCGESNPYKFTVSSNSTIYINISDNGSGVLVTC
jgi:hypothetical protein